MRFRFFAVYAGEAIAFTLSYKGFDDLFGEIDLAHADACFARHEAAIFELARFRCDEDPNLRRTGAHIGRATVMRYLAAGGRDALVSASGRRRPVERTT